MSQPILLHEPHAHWFREASVRSIDALFGATFLALNRLTNMVDAVGTTVYTYTSGGFLYTEDDPFGDDTVTNYYTNRLRPGVLRSPSQRRRRGIVVASSAPRSPKPHRGGIRPHPANMSLLTELEKAWCRFSTKMSPHTGLGGSTNNTTPAAFTNNGLGRLRAQQQWQTNTGGGEDIIIGGGGSGNWTFLGGTYYIYDGNRVIQERGTNGNPTVSYTRGNDLSGTMEGAGGIGGLLARTDGYNPTNGSWSTNDYYHADGNGNITYLVNSTQTLAASYQYDAYGNILSSSGSLASSNTYRFSSKEYIPTAGLYYYLYRFYDPLMQRWINRDPLGEPGFENERRLKTVRITKFTFRPVEMGKLPNIYDFVRNRPADNFDPLGLIDMRDDWPCPKDKPPCPAGQTQTPYWQIMGYSDVSSCATAEWDLIRDGVAGGLGAIGGTILGGTYGGIAGGAIGGMFIPVAICTQLICN